MQRQCAHLEKLKKKDHKLLLTWIYYPILIILDRMLTLGLQYDVSIMQTARV